MDFIISLNSEKKEYSLTSLLEILRLFHVWMAQIHSVVGRNFYGDAYCQLDHQQMTLWLFGEVFNPKSGFPVLGSIERGAIDNYQHGPGPVQVWLSKLLQDPRLLFTVSLAIVGIWFKNTSRKWKQHFKIDHYFWARVPLALTKHIGKLENSDQNISKHREDPKSLDHVQIGNFKLFDMNQSRRTRQYADTEKLLSWVNFSLCGNRPKAKDNISISILKRFDRASAKMPKNREIHATFPKLRIAIIKHEAAKRKFGVRLLSSDLRQFVERKHWKAMVERFIGSLEFYSGCIFSFLQIKGKELDGISQSQFLKWFGGKLYGKKATSITPIIGLIKKAKSDDSRVPIYDEVQTFIIRTFSQTHHFKYHEASLALLGYWFKNCNPRFWEENFKNDKGYSKSIMEAVHHKAIKKLN
jgi:hypothetical protein